ncbi:ComEC/Rec2 family competence protein [uncultured Veillonella sp.]|uniref:ComEC/Rec2 family competence protein n=1 Tax=uncultured Veillonella sp. TaxID=159268 RepID=UPI002614DFB2|nr:ComEC/Rec2 family competence protein [uncultured Veillonella sp.]
MKTIFAFFKKLIHSNPKSIPKVLGIMMLTLLLTLTLSGCSSKIQDMVNANQSKAATSTEAVQGTLDVYALDIGQGDAFLIRVGDEYSLIDTGDVDHRDNLVAYLKQYKVKKLKNVIITHPHADHLGGFFAIADAGIPMEHVYDNGMTYSSSVYRTYMKTVDRLKIPRTVLYKGDVVDFGNGAKFTVYAPWQGDPVMDNKGKADLNNNSIVGKLEFGKFSMLFTGDAEKPEENRLIKEQNTKLSSRIIKVGHHGSKTSSQKDFLRSVRPEFAIISAGQNNDYGHPHKEALERLRAENITVYQTKTMGTIQIHSDGNTWQITQEK